MSSRRVLSFATFVLTALCLARRTCSRQMREEFNKNIVEQGLGGLLGDGDASAAAYFAEDYIEHNPTGPNGLEFVVDFAVTNRPENFTYEIGGVWAEGDFVVVSGRASFAGSPSVTADIYKVLNGKIVEHWDVIQDEVPAELTASGNPMWPVSTEDISRRDADLEEANRRTVIDATNRLFSFSDTSVLAEFWNGDDYIQHNPELPNGVDGLAGFISSTQPGDIVYEIGLAVAYGDYVVLHSRNTWGLLDSNVAVDIFRLEDGIIVEHWDVLQTEVPPTETVSGNRMFPPTN